MFKIIVNILIVHFNNIKLYLIIVISRLIQSTVSFLHSKKAFFSNCVNKFRTRIKLSFFIVKNYIVSTVKNINTSQQFLHLRSYFKTRKFTMLIFCASFILLIISLLSINMINKVNTVDTVIQISSQTLEPLDIKAIEIHLEYNNSKKDLIRIMLQLNNKINRIQERELCITMPSSFNYINNYNFDVKTFRFRKSEKFPRIYYYYKFKPGKSSYSLYEEFEGNIFKSNIKDISSKISLITNNDYYYIEKIPVKISIFGIGNIDNIQIYPEPTLQNRNVIQYNYIPGLQKEPPRDITITGTDKKGDKNKEFYIFFIGIFAGVLASIITGIFLEIVKYIEKDGQA